MDGGAGQDRTGYAVAGRGSTGFSSPVPVASMGSFFVARTCELCVRRRRTLLLSIRNMLPR